MKTFLLLLMTLSGLQNVISQSCTATITAGGPTTFCEGSNVVLTANGSGGSGTWTQKANLGSLGRQNAVSFSIGNKGYLGTGLDGAACRNDFWEYDPTSNAWTQKANFGGGVRWHATGFSIGSKGYMGTGSDLTTGSKNDFWEYDPTLNTWTQKANFGGSAREGAKGFSIGNKGYLGTGFDPLTGYTSDFWEYDPSSNAWTQKADFFSSRYEAISFSIGNKGYLGIGGAAGGYANDLWEYDPSSNAWTQKAYFGGTIRGFSLGFSIGNKGYIGTGVDPRAGVYKNDFWEFDPNANTWIQKTNFGGSSRGFATGFSIGNKGYIGTGIDSSIYKNDLWEFDLGYTYLWSTGETTPTITAASSGSYTVTITNNDGCSATSDTVVVNAKPTPAMNTPTNQIICNGIATSAVEFAGVEIDTTYSWTNDNTSIGLAASGTGNIASITAINTSSIPQVANITVTPGYNGCTGTEKTFTITINPASAIPIVNVVNNCGNSVLSTTAAGTILWSTGASTSSITVISAGTYTVTQTVAGCVSTAGTASAAPKALPSTPIVKVDNYCGSSILSTTSPGPLLWSNGSTRSYITVYQPGTYSVTLTQNGCTSAAGFGTAAPKKAPLITAANIIVSATLNDCSAAVLFGSNVTVTGIPTPTVLYKIGDKIITSPYKFPVGSTSIRVIANNSCGTSLKTFLIKVTDNQNPTIDCKPAAARTVRYSTYTVSGKEFDATASDNCGHLSLIYSLSGATVVPYKSKNTSLENVKLNIGTTTITWKATDESNLISTCNTIVTVKRADDNSLIVTLPNISNTLTKSAEIQKPVTLIAKAIPNPSVNYFTLELKSNKKESITIKVIDVAGRMIEKRTNIQANSTLQIGNHYAKGVYFAEIRQGREKVILQLIKEGN